LNLEIPEVVESPAELAVGAEWVVTIHAMKTRWNSRSRVLELDRDRGCFAYRSQSDDGNPSFADWRWQLDPDAAGTRVTVEVGLLVPHAVGHAETTEVVDQPGTTDGHGVVRREPEVAVGVGCQVGHAA
jgi:hypothetical protein